MIARLRQLYIPIFTQITVPYILLAILVAGGATFIITRVIFDSVQERFSNQLVETALLAHESLVREEDDLLAALRFISHIQGIDEAVDQRLFSRLRELILPVASNSSLDGFAILDSEGLRLLSLRLNAQGDGFENLNPEIPYREFAFVQSILEGQEDEAGDKFSGIVVSGGEEYFFVSGPILRTDGTLAGVALAGKTVTNLASHLREETLAQLSFYSLDGELLASTFGEPRSVSSEESTAIIERQDEASLARVLRDSEIDYNELLSPWEARAGEDLGLLGVALPTNFLVQASQFSRSNTLLLTMLALLLVLVVGVFVARRITYPIQDLKDASLKVAAGNLQISITPRSRDEIGILAQTFNTMVGGLNQSKRELLNAYEETIEGWAQATDLRDHQTEDHSRRVADLTIALAQAMGLQGERLVHMRRGALLH
ncbi:MAG: cache domain-containing protein, partial [Anaerolineales bacterium]